VLIDQDRIAVGIGEHEIRRAGGGFTRGWVGVEATALDRLLKVTHVVEVRKRGLVAVPAGVERQHVLLEHALEEANLGGVVVLEDDPVLRRVARHHLEAELFVEHAGSGQILDGKADREVSELHGKSPDG